MELADYITRKPVIETDRLILRPMTERDVPLLYEWMPDITMYEYCGKGPSKSEKNPELKFQKNERQTKSFYLGTEDKDCGKIIGDIRVYLIENDRMAAVAIRISKEYQRKGYGSECLSAITEFCFTHTELKRLYAEIDVRNIASVRLFEKCGYKREGLIVRAKL